MNYWFWKRLRVACILKAEDRSEYLIKHNIFASVGTDFLFQPRKIPLDAKYIKFHNNVKVASNVTFVAHDIIHMVFNKKNEELDLPRHMECIEVMDNVFIGANSTILGNVKIGPNAIIAAGSIVTKDVPPGKIVGGGPAKIIGEFDQLLQKRINEDKDMTPNGAWERFNEIHRIVQ